MRTAADIRHDLILGLSRAKGDAPTIKLNDLKACVGADAACAYIANERADDPEWVAQEHEDGFRLVMGVREERMTLVPVYREKLLEALVRIETAQGTSAAKRSSIDSNSGKTELPKGNAGKKD